jgi:hypothetical protein
VCRAAIFGKNIDDVLPFAGLRDSELGVGGIPCTMHDMQIDRMLVLNTPG